VKRVTAITPDVHASATLDADADSFTANDTITIDGVTYTFVASVDETTAAYSVLLSGTTAQNLTRLISAINGTGAQAVDYGIGTAAHTTVTAAEAAGDTLTVTSIVGGAAGNAIAVSKVTTDTDIVWGTANLAGGANGTITVAEDLATETPSGSPTLVVVGFQFASADATIDASGVLPTLSATAKDLTELGLIPGEPIFIGGDLAAEQFATSADNGFKRVRSVTATDITLDKSDDTLVTDAGSGKTLRVFFGRVLKNEARVLRVRRTYQLERTLGAPDDSSTDEQAEYLTGSLFNEFAINVPQAEKITCDATFLSMDQEFRESWEGLKTGTRPDLEDADAFNTSTDFSRIKLARVSSVDEAPEPLFAYATALTLNVSNNGSLNKAIGTLGGIGINIGSLTVGGSIEAYFADVAAVSAVRNNDDITLDFAIVRNNAGLFIDLPLLALSGGQLTVEQDQPIKVPLEMQAARGRKVDPDMDHTILLSFFDYLPDLADE